MKTTEATKFEWEFEGDDSEDCNQMDLSSDDIEEIGGISVPKNMLKYVNE